MKSPWTSNHRRGRDCRRLPPGCARSPGARRLKLIESCPRARRRLIEWSSQCNERSWVRWKGTCAEERKRPCGYHRQVDVLARHNVAVSGRSDGPSLMFAHGFGCDQHMWRFVAPRFEGQFRVILFDHMGAGGSAVSEYDSDRYSSLRGYASDVLDICGALELEDVTFVGHSVSAMIGVLAAIREPALFARLVLVGPSPRYTDDGAYVGGFTSEDIVELLDSLDSNYLGWSASMAPLIMGNADRPELGDELTASFCRSDPRIAREFARVTFLSDNRLDLAKVAVPTIILQSSNDVIAPISVGEYTRDAIPGAQLVMVDATGHCPNLSAPDATADAIADFIALGTPN
jgi:sigma-B regulation protein RsbQ